MLPQLGRLGRTCRRCSGDCGSHPSQTGHGVRSGDSLVQPPERAKVKQYRPVPCQTDRGAMPERSGSAPSLRMTRTVIEGQGPAGTRQVRRLDLLQLRLREGDALRRQIEKLMEERPATRRASHPRLAGGACGRPSQGRPIASKPLARASRVVYADRRSNTRSASVASVT